MKKFGQFNGSLRIFLDCICVIKSGGFDQNMGNGKFETSGGMLPTLRCLIKGYTRLFNFRNFDTLPSLIRVYPLIKFWKSVQPPHFFPTLCLPVFKKMSTLPVYQAHFYPTRLFDFQKYSPLPSYQGLPFYQAPKSMYKTLSYIVTRTFEVPQ